MQKKKVLIMPGALKIGGAEKVARDIARYADPARYDFHYIVFGEKIGEYEQQLPGCEILHFAEPSDNYLQYVLRLTNLMRAQRYHAVHAHTMFSCGWAMLAGKIAGVPVRITHAHSALDDGGGIVKAVYERLMRRLILSCSTDLAACGERAGIRLFGERAWRKKGKLILNGIDSEAFAYSGEKRQAIRARYGLEDCFLLGHTGHLTEVKNQKFLLKLMQELRKVRPDARLLLLGEGEDRPMLEAVIRQLGLEKYVILAGNVENVAPFLSTMDVFVFPSLFEGMPLSLLEAQANGLPCVVSDKVPQDVFVTDLVQPLPLTDSQLWVSAICTAKRGRPAGVTDVRTSMENVYRLYEKDQNSVSN